MTESDRTTLTFRQAEGFDPMPSQLALREISDEARALIWSTCLISIRQSARCDDATGWQTTVGNDWFHVLMDWHVRRQYKPADEFSTLLEYREAWLKQAILQWDYTYLFDFITFLLRHDYGPKIGPSLAKDFEDARLAYFIRNLTIYPSASPQDGLTLRTALSDLSQKEYGGARSHISEAARLLSSRDWPGSVRESIHSVESVAKVIEPSAKTLSDALKKLSVTGAMNPNLKRGLEALYNYSSDEAGIRHAKVFEADANVDETDALYMLGACAAFVSFLIARSR